MLHVAILAYAVNSGTPKSIQRHEHCHINATAGMQNYVWQVWERPASVSLSRQQMHTRANRAHDAGKPQELLHADAGSSLSGSHATDETSLEW